MTENAVWTLKHPRTKMDYANAIAYVERWLTENALTEAERERGVACHVYDYFDGNAAKLIERPWVGVRVSEVDFSCPTGGGSYMQVDVPWGVAFCGQVERCIIALIECWNEDADAEGPNYGETDEEFWRLQCLVDADNKSERDGDD